MTKTRRNIIILIIAACIFGAFSLLVVLLTHLENEKTAEQQTPGSVSVELGEEEEKKLEESSRRLGPKEKHSINKQRPPSISAVHFGCLYHPTVYISRNKFRTRVQDKPVTNTAQTSRFSPFSTFFPHHGFSFATKISLPFSFAFSFSVFIFLRNRSC